MSSQKMGPGVLVNEMAGAPVATPSYADIARQAFYAAEYSTPRKVSNPFNNPAVIEDDGTDLWVLSPGAARSVDSPHLDSVMSSCVTRVSRAGVVLDVGYWSQELRAGGTSSITFFLMDLVWCAANNRLFAVSFSFRTNTTILWEVSRGPIAFTKLWQYGSASAPVQLGVYGSRVFLATVDGILSEFDAAGAMTAPTRSHDLNADQGVTAFRFAIDETADRMYIVDVIGSRIGWMNIAGGIGNLTVNNPAANMQRIWIGPHGITYVSTTDRAIHRMNSSLAILQTIDLSENLSLILAVKFDVINTKVYVTGLDGANKFAILRLPFNLAGVENTTTLSDPTDGSDENNTNAETMSVTRIALTDPSGNVKLWCADPAVSSAVLTPTGRVVSVDLSDSGNPVAFVTSQPFIRWV